MNSTFDSASLIDQLVNLEVQNKINPLRTKKTELQRENTFLDAVATNVGQVKTAVNYNAIKDGSTSLSPKSVTSNDTDNEHLTVTADDTAVAQTFEVEVSQLATNTIRKSNQAIRNDLTSASLTSVANFKGGVTLSDGTVTINGVTQTFTASTNTIGEIETFLGTFAGVTATYNTGTGKFDLTGITSLGSSGDTSNMLSALGLNNAQISGGNVTGIQNLEAAKPSATLTSLGVTGTTLTVNGANITYDPNTDTLQTLVTKVNNSAAAKVSASYDSINGEIILTNKDTGALSITVSSNGDISPLNLNNIGSETLGDNAEFSISTLNGGTTLVSNSNTVEGLITGVTLDLSKVTTGPVTITIAEDASGYRTKVDAILTSVNTLIQRLNQTDSSFSRNMISRIKSIMGSIAGVDGVDTYTSFIEVGLKSNLDADGNFTGYSLETDLFDDAFADAPDELNKILWGNSDDADSIFDSLSDGDHGILVQLQDLLDNYVDPDVPTDGLISQVQESINSQIATVDDRIERTQTSIDSMEARMRKQFSQLDLINAQFQQQQSAIASLVNQSG